MWNTLTQGEMIFIYLTSWIIHKVCGIFFQLCVLRWNVNTVRLVLTNPMDSAVNVRKNTTGIYVSTVCISLYGVSGADQPLKRWNNL